MPITISGSTGIAGVDGSAATPAVQGTDTNTGVYYPAADQVAIATNGAQRVLVDASGNMTVTGTLQANGVTGSIYPMVLGTVVTATGTSVDFTGIPSWVKRVTVTGLNISTNGTSLVCLRLGTSAGFLSSGYAANFTNFSGAAFGSTGASTGEFAVTGNGSAADTRQFTAVLTQNAALNWMFFSVGAASNSAGNTSISAGAIILPGTLDRIRLTTISGTDTFDLGTVNILYEG